MEELHLQFFSYLTPLSLWVKVIALVVMGKDDKEWTKPCIISCVFPAERLILLSQIK